MTTEELREQARVLQVMLEDPGLTQEGAVRLANLKWWELDGLRDRAALVQLRQPKLVMLFDLFHRGTEKLLGRSVWTHEFARPDLLLEDHRTARQEAEKGTE